MLNKIKKELKINSVNILITLVYFLMHLYILSNHEMWRDEAQAWTIVKNTSFIELFKLLRVEGHPILWFLVIMPFVKIGFPFKYFGILSLAIMTLSVYIFLKKSPFPVTVSIFILFCSPFFYYNAVISRVYCLCVLLTVLICIYFKNRFDKPILYLLLVSLLLQTQIKISGLVIGLCLEYAYEAMKRNKKLLKYLFIPFTSFILLIIELLPFGEYKQASSSGIESFTFDTKAKILRGFTRIAKSSWGIESETQAYIVFALIFALIAAGIVIAIRRKNLSEYIRIGLIAVCSCGVYYVITAFVHGSHSQMATILACITLLLCWVLYSSDQKNKKNISLGFLLLFSCLSISIGFKDAYKDLNNIYSYGEQTANYILENLEENSVVLLSYDDANSTVYAYVDSNKKILFYDTDHQREYLYHKWGEDFEDINTDAVFNSYSNNFLGKETYYLTRRIIEDKRFKLIFTNQNEESLTGENYNLYRLAD